ncbi:Hypothetical predicted protein, partial [Lynx pardinus]
MAAARRGEGVGWAAGGRQGAARVSGRRGAQQRKKYSNSNIIMHETSQYHVQ